MTITLRKRNNQIGISTDLCEALNIPDTTHVSFERDPNTGEYVINEGSFLNDGDYKVNKYVNGEYIYYSISCKELHDRLSEFYGRPYNDRLVIDVEQDSYGYVLINDIS